MRTQIFRTFQKKNLQNYASLPVQLKQPYFACWATLDWEQLERRTQRYWQFPYIGTDSNRLPILSKYRKVMSFIKSLNAA